MRRQYHTRQTQTGQHTWDVHRLVELSRDLPVVSIPLEQICELDEDYWCSGDPNPTCRDFALHAKLIEETDLKFPVILCADGRIMDGMHRVCKALNLGLPNIKAVRFEITPEPDYVDVDPETLSYDEPW